MNNKLLYFIGGIVFIIGSIRVFLFEKFEFRYYKPLDLDEYFKKYPDELKEDTK